MKRSTMARLLCLCALVAVVGMPSALAHAAEGDLAAADGAGIAAQGDNLAGGTCGTCDWFVDAGGKLVIQPSDGVSGELAANNDRRERFFPWMSADNKARSEIKVVEIRKGVSLEGPANYMFGSSMGGMPITSADLSGFDTSKVTSMAGMFSGNVSKTSNDPMNLEAVYVSDLWSTASLAKKDDMFNACTKLVGGNGTAYDEAHVDSEYARIDVEGEPGYFTKRTSLPSCAGEAKKAGFTDLAAGAWYLNDGGRFPDSQTLYLDYTIARGFMSGYTGARKGQFGPDDDLSRGMAATIIYRMATGKTAETTNNDVDTPFSDVPRGAWYAAAVKWCADEGVVTGYSGTDKFGPEDPITREQLATIIGRYMDPEAEAGEDVSQFKDSASISAFARAGIAYCSKQGIMTGIGDSGNFQPGGKATRCQMSKVIAVTARMAE